MHSDRPDVVVLPTGTADVAAAVRVAQEYGLEIVVRGGGHSVGGLSTADGGMVIDLSSMHAVDVDPIAHRPLGRLIDQTRGRSMRARPERFGGREQGVVCGSLP